MNLSEKLSKTQQYAVVSILIKIMEADGVIDPNEIKFINQVLKEFEISEREMENIDSYDISKAILELKGIDTDLKTIIIDMFIAMSKCDGYSDPRELKIIESLGI